MTYSFTCGFFLTRKIGPILLPLISLPVRQEGEWCILLARELNGVSAVYCSDVSHEVWRVIFFVFKHKVLSVEFRQQRKSDEVYLYVILSRSALTRHDTQGGEVTSDGK